MAFFDESYHTAGSQPYRQVSDKQYTTAGNSFPLLGDTQAAYSAPAYLDHLNSQLTPAACEQGGYTDQPDMVSNILDRQVIRQAMATSQLAQLICNRRQMAQKHLDDIDFRLEDTRSHLSILQMLHGPQGHREWDTFQRRLLDLERQKRQVQRQLWQDTSELEQHLLEQRGEYVAAKSRMDLLAGLSGEAGYFSQNNRGDWPDGPSYQHTASMPANTYKKTSGGGYGL